MRGRILFSILIAACVGCQNTTPTTPNKPTVLTKKSPKPGDSPAPDTLASTPVINPSGGPGQVKPTGDVRLIDPSKLAADTVQQVNLIGKVKLISDKGLGIISNNTGSLVSNNGGGLISDKGLGLVSNGSANYGVLQTAASENSLADARIEVLDAQGRVLVGPDGFAISTVSDNQGNYAFKTTLPKENLVLRVNLYQGGQLMALLTRDKVGGESAVPVAIDTASSLGTAYVLDKYVQKRPEVLNLLPAVEAEKLQSDMEAARKLLPSTPPSYKPADLVQATEDLRAKEPKLAATIKRIEDLLLAGQKNLGNGLAATSVPLAGPLAIVDDGAGGLLVLEAFLGRVRHIKDGVIKAYPSPEKATAFGLCHDIVRGANGELYIGAFRQGKIIKLLPDGSTVTLAGTGKLAAGAVDVKATTTTLNNPTTVAFAPDGAMYICEAPENGEFRFLKVDKDGILRKLPNSPAWGLYANLHSMEVAADGSVYVLDTTQNSISRLKPDGEWEIFMQGIFTETYSRILLGPDGSLYISETARDRIIRRKPDGTVETFVGSGKVGFAGDGGPATAAEVSDPSGMYFAADGTFYFCDMGNGLIRKVDKNGIISTVAGSTGLSQQGDSLAIAVNGPGGLVIDSQGRLVISEIGSSLIKRLEDKQLKVIAGTTRGFAGDGGPATAAQFDSMIAIAYAPDGSLYAIDNGNLVMRKIAPDGTVSTVVGNRQGGPKGVLSGPVQPALSEIFQLGSGVTIAPDGLPVWADMGNNFVWKLRADNQIELVAGGLHHSQQGYSGDGGPGKEARLKTPLGLTYDKAGNLYISDAGNLCIRRVKPDGTIELFAGVPAEAGLAKLMQNTPAVEGSPAKDALIVGPGPLAFDADGNLFVMEMGTINLAAYGLTGSELDFLPKTRAKIRKITPDGKIYTIAGEGTTLLNDPASDNTLVTPGGLVFDKEGRLIFADTGLNQIKVLPKGTF